MKTRAEYTFEKRAFLGINVFPEGRAEDYSAPSTYLKENVNAGLGAMLGGAAGAPIGAGLAAGGAALAGLKTKKPGFIKKLLGAKPKVVQTKNLKDLTGPAALGVLGGGALSGATGAVRSIRETDRAFGVPEGSEQGIPELTSRALAATTGLVGAGVLGAKVLPMLNKAKITKTDRAVDFLTSAGAAVGDSRGIPLPTTNRVGQKIQANNNQNAVGAAIAALTGGIGADYAMRSGMSKAPVELETN